MSARWMGCSAPEPCSGAQGRAGYLFVTLHPPSDAPSAAEDLLVRFTRVWTPERLAA